MNYEEIANFCISTYGLGPFIMSALISALIQVLKIPIKKLTSKIKNDSLKKLANKSIIILAFALAFGIDFAGHKLLPNMIPFDVTISLAEGACANLLYIFGEGIIPKASAKKIAQDIKTLSNTGTAEAAAELINDVDGEEEKEEVKEKSAVDEFKNLINK